MGDMKHYVSTSDTYTGGELFKAGKPFVTDAEKGDDWEEVTPAAAAAVEAATDRIPDDADIEALTKAPLQAVAFMRHIQGIGDMDADELKTAIRASYEPKL